MYGELCPASDAYPTRLLELRDPPARLYWRGTAEPRFSGPIVAVVGARAASGDALAMAGDVGRCVAHAGGVIISGGALGVDAAAHRGALAGGGVTMAVLAAGFTHLYPRCHRTLFTAIEERGALLTPYQVDVPPRRYHFVRRNRIIAGLADVTVVIGASRASGSLYTARAAREIARPLVAAPGAAGCEVLLAEGAMELRCPRDVLRVAAGDAPSVSVPSPGDELERVVLGALGEQPVASEALAARLGRRAREVDRALVGLELARLALAVPGRRYIRSALGQEAL